MLEMIIYEEHGASIWHRFDLKLTKISSRTAQKTLRLLMAQMVSSGEEGGKKKNKDNENQTICQETLKTEKGRFVVWVVSLFPL